MTNLGSILKSRDITLPTKVHLVKAMVFPVVMYGCESWTIKKTEHQRIDAFELWCWRRHLRVPWTAGGSNQSFLKFWIFTGRTDVEAETPILWPPVAKRQPVASALVSNNPDAGKDWRQEEKGTRDDEMVGWHHWLDGHEFEQVPGRLVMDREGWHAAVHRVTKSWTWLNNWTEVWIESSYMPGIKNDRCNIFTNFRTHGQMSLHEESHVNM